MNRSDNQYIKRGVEINLRAADAGSKIKRVAYDLTDLARKGYLQDDVYTASKTLAASASDARMACGLSVAGTTLRLPV